MVRQFYAANSAFKFKNDEYDETLETAVDSQKIDYLESVDPCDIKRTSPISKAKIKSKLECRKLAWKTSSTPTCKGEYIFASFNDASLEIPKHQTFQ